MGDERDAEENEEVDEDTADHGPARGRLLAREMVGRKARRQEDREARPSPRSTLSWKGLKRPRDGTRGLGRGRLSLSCATASGPRPRSDRSTQPKTTFAHFWA
jgi:hypothetical protein